MNAFGRRLLLGIPSLFLVPAVHADGVNDIVRRYIRDHA